MANPQGKSEWASVLEESLAEIKNRAGLSKLPSTKNGFKQLVKKDVHDLDYAIAEGIKILSQRINEFIPDANEFKPSEKRGGLRKETELSENRKAAILQGNQLEVSLERAIVASADDEDLFFNHLSLVSGIHNSSSLCKQVAVDLVVKRPGSLLLIELKAWDNKSDSPVDALLEISAYFLVYQKMLEFDSVSHGGKFEKAEKYNLILMAPKEYFQYWGDDEYVLPLVYKAFNIALHGYNAAVELRGAQIDIAKNDLMEGVRSIEGNGKSFNILPMDLKRRIRDAFQKSIADHV